METAKKYGQQATALPTVQLKTELAFRGFGYCLPGQALMTDKL